MGIPEPAAAVLPLVGVLAHEPWPDDLEAAASDLFGPPVLRSPRWLFVASRYYESELGPELTRGFLAFAPRDPSDFPDWKIASNAWEDHWRDHGRRRVNLDPGYLTLNGLFLASTKPGRHRLYLRAGIYAEITLQYAARGWQPLPWTFPDFREPTYHLFLSICRDYLKRALRPPGG